MKKKTVFISLLLIIVFFTGAEKSYATPTEILGFFETPLVDKSPDRTANIKLAAQEISQVLLQPGEIFSFNMVVGQRSKERGYKLASMFENGKVVQGLGGGICQLSTTLYQAALSADLKVTEAHHHSLPVTYIALGKDATVSWGAKDFKFQNSSAGPIALTAEVVNNRVRATIHRIAEEEPVELYYNDTLLEIQPSAYLTQGVTYIPLRSVSEHLGYVVGWNQEEKKITIEVDGNSLTLELNKSAALLNDETLLLSSPPFIKDGVTFVPLRFIAENFQLGVRWSEEDNAIYIF